eukprot:CAMPEP_0113564906 /NCGR_PEP_ID=MMETSP0015_2-20120614/21883_1 /TAXON_ID=2838 /ORGANISM="Odontella" /LENGTH=253 /DNA_ID=CAMNT_0000467047 /DNA_START=563 /DNA_END=1321 /DNA_ORIENTATION=- /assembly_acc=CAM_ASM_000160
MIEWGGLTDFGEVDLKGAWSSGPTAVAAGVPLSTPPPLPLTILPRSRARWHRLRVSSASSFILPIFARITSILSSRSWLLRPPFPPPLSLAVTTSSSHLSTTRPMSLWTRSRRSIITSIRDDDGLIAVIVKVVIGSVIVFAVIGSSGRTTGPVGVFVVCGGRSRCFDSFFSSSLGDDASGGRTLLRPCFFLLFPRPARPPSTIDHRAGGVTIARMEGPAAAVALGDAAAQVLFFPWLPSAVGSPPPPPPSTGS